MVVGMYNCHGYIQGQFFCGVGKTHTEALDDFFSKVYWVTGTQHGKSKHGLVRRFLDIFSSVE